MTAWNDQAPQVVVVLAPEFPLLLVELKLALQKVSDFAIGAEESGPDVGTRRALNLIQDARISLAAADDPVNDRVSVTISASPPEAGEITNALGNVPADRAGDHFTGPIDCGPHQTIGGPLGNMAKYSEDFAAAEHHHIAPQDSRPRLQPRRQYTARTHHQRRADPRRRLRQWLPLRRTRSCQQSVGMVRRAQGEDAGRDHPRLYPALFQPLRFQLE